MAALLAVRYSQECFAFSASLLPLMSDLSLLFALDLSAGKTTTHPQVLHSHKQQQMCGYLGLLPISLLLREWVLVFVGAIEDKIFFWINSVAV